ncbi:GNAT family protein [Actinoplanes sp. NPDC026619]|uniref:GNAT family N-acetyltransferase n=1 Tax=Actinoplanes sp. NPDC026619 TaxID=3155798 RepID=UPI0033CA870B
MTSFWAGELVTLRAMSGEDWEYYKRFNENSRDSRSVNRIELPRSDDNYRREAVEVAEKYSVGDTFALGIERNDQRVLVGALSTRRVDNRAGSFEYGLEIERSHQRRGYGSEAAALSLRYMFDERRHRKCTVLIYYFNYASVALHKALVFVNEGRLREHEFFQGRYCDVIIMGILDTEFRDKFGGGEVADD